jgi:hypothetical protein
VDEQAGIVRVPFSPEDVHAHNEHDHIAAIFADREHASEAVEELRALGLGSEHLGLAVHAGEPVAFERDEDAEMLHDARVGALAGAPIGAIAGITLASLAVPPIGVVGLGGTLAVAGVSALWGGVLGAYTGVAVGEGGSLTHEHLSYTALKNGEVLVVVCGHGHGDAVREIMQRHDGKLHAVEAHTG